MDSKCKQDITAQWQLTFGTNFTLQTFHAILSKVTMEFGEYPGRGRIMTLESYTHSVQPNLFQKKHFVSTDIQFFMPGLRHSNSAHF